MPENLYKYIVDMSEVPCLVSFGEMAVSDSERRLSDVHLVMTGRMDVHKIRGVMRWSYVRTIYAITLS